MWRDIADELRDAIASGAYAPGDEVPTEAELQKRHDASRDTVRKALAALTAEGLITAGQGRRGRQVRRYDPITINLKRTESRTRALERATAGADAWTADVTEQGHKPGQRITIEIDAPPAQVRDALGLPEGESALARHHVRSVDGSPHNLTTTWYPMEIANRLPRLLNPADIPEGGIVYMLNNGIEQVRFPLTLEARMPTPEEMHALRMPPGVPVMIEHRTGISPDGQAVKVTVTTWPAHLVRLEMELEG